MLEAEGQGRSGRDLAAVLRQFRTQAGLSGDRLAARCGISQSKLSKIETGKLLPTVLDVERILTALGVPSSAVEEIAAVARIANTQVQTTRAVQRMGLHKKQAELAAIEASATELRYFLPAMITGLLATPEYARASLAFSTVETARAVAGKLDRQAILYDRSKRFTFVLTEPAARWPICPPTQLAVQLDKLVSLSRLPSVRISVIPIGSHYPGRGPLNTFTVYDDRLATADTFGGLVVMRDPRDIAAHLDLFAMFEGFAVWDDAARAMLGAWAEAARSGAA